MVCRFVDTYLDEQVPGYPCVSVPRFSTLSNMSDSGDEQSNSRWEHPLHRFLLPDAIREHVTFEAVHDHWMVMRGPFHTFPFRDPLDFASVGLELPNTEPVVSGLDQVIGNGNGARTVFQLQKTYTRGAQTYTRPIYLPIPSTVIITVNGVDPLTFSPPMTFSVERETGLVTASYPPIPGHVVRAGFLFDVEVKFESDDVFEGIVRTYGISGFADLTLVETRPCRC